MHKLWRSRLFILFLGFVIQSAGMLVFYATDHPTAVALVIACTVVLVGILAFLSWRAREEQAVEQGRPEQTWSFQVAHPNPVALALMALGIVILVLGTALAYLLQSQAVMIVSAVGGFCTLVLGGILTNIPGRGDDNAAGSSIPPMKTDRNTLVGIAAALILVIMVLSVVAYQRGWFPGPTRGYNEDVYEEMLPLGDDVADANLPVRAQVAVVVLPDNRAPVRLDFEVPPGANRGNFELAWDGAAGVASVPARVLVGDKTFDPQDVPAGEPQGLAGLAGATTWSIILGPATSTSGDLAPADLQLTLEAHYFQHVQVLCVTEPYPDDELDSHGPPCPGKATVAAT